MTDIVVRTRICRPPVKLTPLTAALGLGLGFGMVPPAHAATFTVTNLTDASPGSLRDALTQANAALGADTVVFQAGLTGTIPLVSAIPITDSVTITGPGAALLTIAPAGTNRALSITGTPAVTISGLTFQGNGTANVDGGAISLVGSVGATSLTIQNSVFNGNVTTGDGGALFLYKAGALSIQASTFTGNQSSGGGGRGGAIKFYNTGAITITDSTFSGNQANRGGALDLYKAGPLTMSGSTLSGNTAGFAGGALFLYKTPGNSLISDSTISGNSTISNGGGGGVFLYSIANPTTITNTTLTGNSTAGAGGAIHQREGSVLNLVSSIAANSTDGGGTGDLAHSGATASTLNADHSLIQNAGANINGTSVANILGSNPTLGPLANNGGPTLTHALLAGSPAIDTGSNPNALAFDQRGAGFLRTSGAATDIGAFEVQGAPPPPPVSNPVPTLSQWAVILLSALTGLWAVVTGFGRQRRRS